MKIDSNQNPRILIIEDDLMLAKMYQTKFEVEKIAAEIAGTGKEALQKAKAGDYRLILLDILLPEVDGFEILKQLKRDDQTKDIPVIILTNLGTSQILVKEGMKLGAADYLIKSQVSANEVVQKVKQNLKK